MELSNGRTLLALALGQFVSLLLTLGAFSSSELARQGIDAPILQSFSNYLLLAAVYGFIVSRRPNRCQVPWYVYFLLAFIDVEANFLVVQAYQYTSITSVMLLDCWAIPCVLLLTWLLLNSKYLSGHLIGALICVTGLALVILSDVHDNDRSGKSSYILGDILVIAGATLYAFSNVSQEFLVKTNDRIELLAYVGIYGSLISACQLLLMEWHEVQSLRWSRSAVLPFVGFGVSMFSFYTFAPILLQISGSAMLNLSLLTSDMWVVAIRALVYHQLVDWLYFFAFATVATGIIVYSLSGDPALNEELKVPYKRISSLEPRSSTEVAREETFRLESSDEDLEA